MPYRKTSKALRPLAAAIIALSLTACATVPKDAPPEIKWPMPPARTRVQFVDYIRGSNDVIEQEKKSTKTLFFGQRRSITLNKPSFVNVKNDILYVSDLFNVRIFDFKNKKATSIGTGLIKNATGLAALENGTLFIGDGAARSIYVFRPETADIIKIVGPQILQSVGGMDVNEETGWLYVVDTKAHNIKAFDYEGNIMMVIGYRGGGAGTFNYPYDIKVGPGGRLYITDSGNFRVQVLDGEGNFLGLFGTIGTMPGSFARPKGIALDPDGNIYVIDSAFGNFQIFNQLGQLLLAVGENGNDPGMHILPIGITIDENGRIYVAEQGNKRVQIYQYFSYPDEEKTLPVPFPSAAEQE